MNESRDGNMSISGFKDFLTEHKVKTPQIEIATKLMSEFNEFLQKKGKGLEGISYEDMQDFSASLMQKKENKFDNYIVILRYGYFTKNNDIIIAIMISLFFVKYPYLSITM